MSSIAGTAGAFTPSRAQAVIGGESLRRLARTDYDDGSMLLRCVKCSGTGVSLVADTWVCPDCAARFPIVQGVARFVDSEAYTDSFGFQWTYFAKSQLDSANGTTRSRDTFVEKTGFRLERLRGARVLDAGCGMGRFAEVAMDAGAEVHAVDLSAAVEAAYGNLGRRGNISFYQADILNLPFAQGTFDYIYSIGVLHHTPSTRLAFQGLVPLLRPGGRIAIWVYSTKLRLMVGSELVRPLTSRLPKPMLLTLCRIANPLYHVHKLPIIGLATRVLLPTSLNPDPEWRWLDTFDWYSPKHQFKHTQDEVAGWFHDAGLIDLAPLAFPVSMSGRRPD
jgi:SAM-dependent methyltransferase